EFEPVVVIGELHARFLGRFTAAVELLGGLLPDVGGLAKILRDPGTDNVLDADGLGGFDDRGKLVVEFIVLHVGGDRVQAILFADGADLLAGAAEVSGKFDFFVANFGDLGDGAVEVVFHQVAYGVQLYADLINFVIGGGPAEATGQ